MPDNDASALPAEEPQDRIQGLGRTLRAAREAERLSIERVAAELRIEPRFLVALEEERFDAVGAPVFAKGYLKLYCEYLGLDFTRLEPLYRARAGVTEPPFAGRRSVERRAASPSGYWAAVALVGAAVVVLLAVWLLRGLGRNVAPPSAPTESASASAAGAGEGAAGAAGDGTGPVAVDRTGAVAVQGTGGAAVGQAGGGAEQRVPAGAPENPVSALQQALSQRGPTVRPPEPIAPAPTEAGGESRAALAAAAAAREPTAASPVGESSAAESPSGESSATEGSADAGPSLQIELQFLQDSWVEVTDARNERLYYGLGRAGDASRLAGRPPLDVLLGNADGVLVEVEGRPYAYPTRRRHGNVAHFKLAAPAE